MLWVTKVLLKLELAYTRHSLGAGDRHEGRYQAACHFLAERRRFRPRGRELARNITWRAVKASARGIDIGITTVGPIDEVRHRLQQGLA